MYLQASGKNLNLNDESQHGLLMQLLKLSYNCLNYDFIGTSTDESSDDLCTVQIPTSWRSGVLAGGTLRHWERTGFAAAWTAGVVWSTALNLWPLSLLQHFSTPQLCSSSLICIIPSLHPCLHWWVTAVRTVFCCFHSNSQLNSRERILTIEIIIFCSRPYTQ